MNRLLTLPNRNGIADSPVAPAGEIANQINGLPLTILVSLMLAILLGSLVIWARFITAYIKGESFFPQLERRRVQPWSLLDLMMAIVVFLLVSIFAATFASRLSLFDKNAPTTAVTLGVKVVIATLQLTAIVIATFFISTRYRISTSDIGWSTKHLLRDIRLGLVAFVMVLPPIYLLMGVATVLFKKPYSHPVIEAIKNDPSTLPMAIWLAVIIAPLTEEFGFRVLLQGFFESLARGRFTWKKFFFGRLPDSDSDNNLLDRPVLDRPIEVELSPITETAGPYANPYQPTTLATEKEAEAMSIRQSISQDDEIKESSELPWWPVILSGSLFGIAHFDYGASWLPLVALGIVLGYLYRITNRIWPSLVVHVCLNGLTMLNLTVVTLFGDPSKIP